MTFDLSAYEKRRAEEIKRTRERMMANKEAVLTALRVIGAATVTVEYSGSGDSGQVDQVVVADVQGQQLDVSLIPKLTVQVEQSEWKDGSFATRTYSQEDFLYNVLANFCMDWLESEHAGWENNDGGQGEMEIVVADGEFTLNHQENYVEHTDYSYSLSNIEAATKEE